jgi:hypothetical protein
MRECLADEVRRAQVRFPIYSHQPLVTPRPLWRRQVHGFRLPFQPNSAANRVTSGRSKIPSPVLLS